MGEYVSYFFPGPTRDYVWTLEALGFDVMKQTKDCGNETYKVDMRNQGIITVSPEDVQDIDRLCQEDGVQYLKNPSYCLVSSDGLRQGIIDCSNDFTELAKAAINRREAGVEEKISIQDMEGNIYLRNSDLDKYYGYFTDYKKDIKPSKRSSVYFDMDGTLAKWYKDGRGLSYPEQILDPKNHYYRDLEPHEFVVDFAKRLSDKGYDVCIISSAEISCVKDKLEWLENNCPFIRKENIFFCPIGADKTNYTKGNAGKSILIDDYNQNLDAWEMAGGFPVKVLNTVNSPNVRYDLIDCEFAEKNPSQREECLRQAMFIVKNFIPFERNSFIEK